MFNRKLKALLPYQLEWQDQFIISKLPDHIGGFNTRDVQRVQSRMLDKLANEKKHIIDAQSQGHLLISVAIHCYYLELLERDIGEADAIEMLAFALQQPGSWQLKAIMHLSLFFSRNKRKMIERETRRKTESVYGKSFSFAEEHSKNGFVSVVTRCAYFDYFSRQGIPELTSIFCAWDAVWIEPIKRDKNSGIVFSRPTTLGRGGQTCRFEFHFEKMSANKDGEPKRMG